MRANKPTLRQNQKGLVSIIVTMVIMVVLSLIVIGFAKLTRRNQQQALDRQLNTQALYAANSGINDAVQAIKAGFTGDKTKCNDPLESGVPGSLTGNNTHINLDANTPADISYSCLLVTQNVKNLLYSNIKTDQSTVIPVIPSDGSTVGSVELSWQDTTGGTSFGGCSSTVFPPVSSYTNCSAGVLRIDIVPVDPAHLNRAGLANNTFTVFAQPGGSSSSVGYTPGLSTTGRVVHTSCSSSGTPKYCSIKIIGLNSSFSSNQFYMRVKSLYVASTLTVCSPACDGSAKTLKGQAVVDATGKSQDVLKRVQIRVHTDKPISTFPEFAIESGQTACKLFAVIPPNSVIPDSTYGGSGNPACQLN